MGPISSDKLHHQFVLDTDWESRVSGWTHHTFGNFYLSTHPSLPVRTVVDESGQNLGFALGWLVAPGTPLDAGDVTLAIDAGTAAWSELEDSIYRLGGRFVFLVRIGTQERLYLDPAGTLGVVFSQSRQRAAATVSALVWDDPKHAVWTAGTKAFPDNKANQYWPAGLTMDPNIRRLLPNHVLDLATWQATRHYPRGPIGRVGTDKVADLVRSIANRLKIQLGLLANRKVPAYLPLTGGQDSRTLLACSRQWVSQYDYVTFDYSPMRVDRGDQVDLGVARYFAGRFGLHHHVIPVQKVLPAGTELEYLQRIGYGGGAGKSHDFLDSCRANLKLKGTWLTGFAGEVGRAFFWRPGDSDSEYTTEALLDRMLQPQTREFVMALNTWRSDLPDSSVGTLLDFAYLEHRVGCWAAPHLYGTAEFSVNLTPFNHREIIDAMLTLPLEYARRQALAGDVIAATWPELLDIPFSQR